MYAIEFEADIRNGIVKLPEKYRLLDSAHVRVVLTVNDERFMGEPEVELDFSNTEIKAFSGRDALELQRTMRDCKTGIDL